MAKKVKCYAKLQRHFAIVLYTNVAVSHVSENQEYGTFIHINNFMNNQSIYVQV